MDLSIGDGEDLNQKEYVKNLQNFLKEKGYFKYIPTGYFGKLTKSALVNFQLDNGLSQTGELDIYSRKFINTLKCNKSYFLDKVIENKEVKYENKETKSDFFC
jgi:peptidoglycan hydrolase-like protein with peptidoglycan-binding domain